MSWFTGVFVYLCIWWLALFTVLPWGNRPHAEPEQGHAPSAPENPRLREKFFITSILSALIWLIIYFLIKIEVIDFYDLAEIMFEEDQI